MKDNYQPPQHPTKLTETQIQALIKFGQEHPEGSSFNEYITSFPELSGVTGFNVTRHNLGSNAGAFITALPKSTEILILNECCIKLEHFEATLKCISNRLTNISFLGLSKNFNVDDNTNDIEPLEFPLMPTSLEWLDLSNNNFGKHILSIAKSLPQSIIDLYIYGNKMGKDALEVFEIVANRLPHLEVLDAGSLGEGIDTLGILKCVRQVVSLAYLSFICNNLNKDCLELLKAFPANMPFLKEIDIRYFNFKSSTVDANDIKELENWFEDHNSKFEPLNKGLFAGFMAYKDAGSAFRLSKDVMSHLIGNHYEPVVELITQDHILD